ncbi:unnamed protein product [Blepharisma stoltei]|uniref:Uncharacterized protein n=1 Tax=Blepharisma stoltei TaxID=1481888 RepID=A0AAU9J8H1_9CILI|nr:unnamed protein product [Blepharisma stoltei]
MNKTYNFINGSNCWTSEELTYFCWSTTRQSCWSCREIQAKYICRSRAFIIGWFRFFSETNASEIPSITSS